MAALSANPTATTKGAAMMMKRRAYAIVLVVVTLLGGSAARGYAAAASQDEWERVVQAAKAEGKLALVGPPGADRRDSLTQAFEKKYGIRVEYHADAGAGIYPKLSAERKAGLYLWDVVVTGTTTSLQSLIPGKVLDPLEPTLILPEAKDGKYWRGGALEFVDPGRQALVMTPFHIGSLFVNSTLANAKEFKSYKDLLDPKWKGKVVADDPEKSGPGQSIFTFFYLHPELGPDFIRALSRQGITFVKNYAQQADMVGQGRFPVGMGFSDATVGERIKKGVPLLILDPRQLKEGTHVSPASGSLSVFNRAPNPNAAKVYINWLLTKEGQTNYIRATGYVSARLDAPTDHAEPWRIPSPSAIKTYTQDALDVKEKVLAVFKEAFGR
jgi:iron(III) transport system substrate-binding protein